MLTQASSGTGRASAEIAGLLREGIASGELEAGKFLPSVRALSREHGVSFRTVMRAVKSLEGEGLVEVRPRHGYRVLPGGMDPARGCPLAFITGSRAVYGSQPHMVSLIAAVREAAERRGWPVLVSSGDGVTAADLLQRLRAGRAFGAALDWQTPEVVSAVKEAGIPAVLVEDWQEEIGIDSVMQDGQQGGVLAVKYLLARGCRRIAWLGTDLHDSHWTDRLGGAVTELAKVGLGFGPGMVNSISKEKFRAEALRLL
ncbi:MAG: GntR family transcriptional regulator, partial [Planctomycetota bacterium]